MKKTILSLALTLSTTVFAHGEDKYDPHNGFNNMPGLHACWKKRPK